MQNDCTVVGKVVECSVKPLGFSVRKKLNVIRSKNVGMSSEKRGEKPHGRKSKGSHKTRDVSGVKRSLIHS
jgi:hypothetical protein